MNTIAGVVAGALAALACCVNPCARAQSPSRAVELIVPFASGGAVDQVARIFAEGIAVSWPGGVVVVNRPGDGGALGKNLVANARPDGSTLAIVSGNEANVSLARGLTPISLLVRGAGGRISATYWQALVGPPGMDKDLVERINHGASVGLTRVRDKLNGLGVSVVGSSAAGFEGFVAAGGGNLPGPAAVAEAAAADVATCFNDSGSSGRIGIWSFEGYKDWQTARGNATRTFVLGFVPGRNDYELADLGYCYQIHPKNAADTKLTPENAAMTKCSSGHLRISRVEEKAALSGQYRFVLEDGQVKSLTFQAAYCPPRKAPARQ